MLLWLVRMVGDLQLGARGDRRWEKERTQMKKKNRKHRRRRGTEEEEEGREKQEGEEGGLRTVEEEHVHRERERAAWGERGSCVELWIRLQEEKWEKERGRE